MLERLERKQGRVSIGAVQPTFSLSSSKRV